MAPDKNWRKCNRNMETARRINDRWVPNGTCRSCAASSRLPKPRLHSNLQWAVYWTENWLVKTNQKNIHTAPLTANPFLGLNTREPVAIIRQPSYFPNKMAADKNK